MFAGGCTACSRRALRVRYVAAVIRNSLATSTPQLSVSSSSRFSCGPSRISLRRISRSAPQIFASSPFLEAHSPLGSFNSSSSKAPLKVLARSPSLVRVLNPGMSQRRVHSTKSKSEDEKPTNGHRKDHEHTEKAGHSHSHSHSIFGHSHSHDDGHSHDAEGIVAALQGNGDRGSHITLVGLFANVILTGAKGTAGWYMHSASLLADAGHSLSDLLGDFVTLFCWKLSRKPPSELYPYGFAKFETLGTTTVSLLLIGGALGIGFHSYNLLIEALSHGVNTLSPGMLHDLLQQATSAAQQVPVIGHSHSHVDVLDPNAAWFAAVSVLAKEWLYRITKKVADEESSPVLYANAVHHRSDAYSSVVALMAILGTWYFPALPLDPIGGILVSVVILWQGLGLFGGAFRELTDAGISSQSHTALIQTLEPLVSPSSPIPSTSNGDHYDNPRLLAIRHLRARRAGSLIYVDLTADVPETLHVHATSELEEKITRALKEARKEISEVRVKFHPVHED
ncbi:hypothetical protein SERLA73DRAFT_180000 [Serpula lacrymans var. lacrymans S7.3]|uniref:Cation efflux protein transmembrane domain-containing protein n=2 Tax=Serpula lacrymans var. lacrymans TaxID=341189 RepID=F8PV94_SERL3|nr:uncharacterized protein SERLADRAFT_465397 [Serpula lacrymans var. lacrymans S7.9]EGN99786.1 hypothetical protein SERLA73DRAFT_180000 [Serpula lacrymans var. lacrymans S7.3]EGO25360.1 hypothetical protein SERLADRAFT_465397 [Serpula lacrymans var. lacrymans S7.9]